MTGPPDPDTTISDWVVELRAALCYDADVTRTSLQLMAPDAEVFTIDARLVEHVANVVAAAERRRQLRRSAPLRMIYYEAIDDEDAALVALAARLRGEE